MLKKEPRPVIVEASLLENLRWQGAISIARDVFSLIISICNGKEEFDTFYEFYGRFLGRRDGMIQYKEVHEITGNVSLEEIYDELRLELKVELAQEGATVGAVEVVLNEAGSVLCSAHY